MSTHPYLGINVSLASAEELRHRGILEEDESLLALFDGILLDENRRRIGGVALSDFIALSDKRLITWARGLFNDTVDSFTWPDVDVAKAETWDPWHGRVIFAFRLPAIAPRSRRIVVKGSAIESGESERVLVNTFDYMPADDVTPLANMIAWTGDQVVSGLSGATLVAAFAEQFPAPERAVAMSIFTAPQPEPPPPSPPIEQPRRRWWQRGADKKKDLEPPSNGANLIADYESRRRGLPAGDGTPALPVSGSISGPISGPISASMPSMLEQPSMYEVSRTLRLFLEAPRNLARSARRAGEMMSGASELVTGLQDPRVRRNAMLGIYQAAAQQEAENGPFAPVGPVVRAAVRFSEPLPEEEAESLAQAQSRRNRIQLRAPRGGAPTQIAAPAAGAQEAEATAPPVTDPVRRSISVRRSEPAAPPPPAPVPAPAAPPVIRATSGTSRVPVRRLIVNPDAEESAAQPKAVPAGVDEEA